MRQHWIAAVALLAVSMAAVPATAQAPDPGGEWPSYGGTNWSQKYSPLDQIDASNFEQLELVWNWQSTDVALIESLTRRYLPPLNASGLKATPLMVNGRQFVALTLADATLVALALP